MKKSLLVLAILVVLLAACAPSQSPEDTQALVNTAVAQTMEAQQQIAGFVAQTINAQIPTFTPTVEFTPTVTPTFEIVKLITDTPFPTITPSIQPPVIQPTDVALETAVPPSYSCDVFTQHPEYLAEIKAGSKFEIKWIIINTGTTTWEAGVDVKYSSGSKMTKVTVVEIPKEMKPNDRYTISLTATAPNQKGHQYMTWTVEGQLCNPSVLIDVK